MAAMEQKMFERAGLEVKLHVPAPANDNFGFEKKDATAKREEIARIGSSLPLLNVGDRGISKSVSRKVCHFGSSTIEQFLVVDQKKVLNKTMPLLVTSYSEDYDTNLVVAANSKIKTLKDLKGKRIRMGQIPNRLALENVLNKEGMSLNDIHQVYGVSVSKVLAKLETGEFDGAITYIPSMPYLLASGKVRVVKKNLMSEAGLIPLPHSLIIGNRQFIEHNPEVTTKFISALKESFAYLQRNPSELVQVHARNTKALGDEEWKVDKLVAERSGAFVGKLQVANLYESKADREATAKNVAAFSEKLQKAKFYTKGNDLTAWFGVTPALKAGAGS